jgi:hypothetical protein
VGWPVTLTSRAPPQIRTETRQLRRLPRFPCASDACVLPGGIEPPFVRLKVGGHPVRYGPEPELLNLSPTGVTWMTGILEGEGTFTLKRVHGSIRVVMTDRDIIERLQVLTGVGIIHSRPARSLHYRSPWDWDVIRVNTVPKLSTIVAPFLLERRRQRLRLLLERHDLPLPPSAQLTAESPEAWAWIAGLLEGEAYFAPGPTAKRQQPQIGVTSVDRDVLERLRDLTRAGSIYSIKRRKESWSPSWVWMVSRRDDVRRIITHTVPLLGARWTERVTHVLRCT